MTIKTVFLSLVAAALACALPGSASAGPTGVPGVDFTSSSYSADNAVFSLGYQFVALSEVEVLGLATWNNWVNVPGSVEVGLWDANGDLLVSAAVGTSSPTVGAADWSYTAIAPVTLAAGDAYYVASYGADANYAFFTNGFVVNPQISFVQDAYFMGASSLTFPSQTSGIPQSEGGGYFGGNLILAPEPATWAMMVLGFGGLAFAGYRKIKSGVVA